MSKFISPSTPDRIFSFSNNSPIVIFSSIAKYSDIASIKSPWSCNLSNKSFAISAELAGRSLAAKNSCSLLSTCLNAANCNASRLSSAAVRSVTLPISRKYIRTGSSINSDPSSSSVCASSAASAASSSVA